MTSASALSTSSLLGIGIEFGFCLDPTIWPEEARGADSYFMDLVDFLDLMLFFFVDLRFSSWVRGLVKMFISPVCQPVGVRIEDM